MKACRIIEDGFGEPSLKELAEAIGLSPSHFHRVFKATTGITPKQYAAVDRARKVRQRLESGVSITEAIYGAGFSSSGRFYEKAMHILGMTPSQYRSGGANEEIKYAVRRASLGVILVASSKKGVVSIRLGNDPDELVRDLQRRFPKAVFIGDDRKYEAQVARAVDIIDAKRIGLALPLDIRCLTFKRRVWQAVDGSPSR